jgi:hypothetical protein
MYAVNGSDFAVQGRFELKNLIWIIPQAFLLWNLGLWLSTTLWGHKHRILTSIMILPALASPILLEFPYSTLGWLTAAIILWSYWIVLLHGGSK